MWSVSYKKMVENVKYLLNPDTYSRATINSAQKGMLKYRVEIVSGILVVGIPMLIIYPLLRPRLKKVKREFLFQYYLQSQLLAKKLDTGNIKLSVHEVEEIIKKAEAKIKL